jgi:hypothetical protein
MIDKGDVMAVYLPAVIIINRDETVQADHGPAGKYRSSSQGVPAGTSLVGEDSVHPLSRCISC